jgi:hypothetical protein
LNFGIFSFSLGTLTFAVHFQDLLLDT